MRKMCVVSVLLLCTLWGSGCVMFHMAALAKQCFAPRVEPCLFPQLSFWDLLVNEPPLGDPANVKSPILHPLETCFVESIRWTTPGVAAILDVALLPLNATIVLFSWTSYHPFTVTRVEARKWRFTWHGENFSTREVHPLRMSVLQGNVTIREYRSKKFSWLNSGIYWYRQAPDTASFGIEAGWSHQWEIPEQSEQEISVFLSHPRMECSSPRFAVLEPNKQWIKEDFYGEGFEVILSEDFIGTVSFEKTTIE